PITTQYDGDADWPVIRVADIALLLAEITNELSGPTSEAFAYLNMIRQRAGLEAYTAAEVASKYDFRMAVRNERRLELAFENQRWFDLLRWGVATETVNSYIAGEAFYSAYSYVVNPLLDWQTMLPVPIDVININPNAAQNVGY
ncbi:MAG: RagB/SusD family nutrient uptake outer membrane protein, partial [Muribaculaceae bacterium]|nr:RagB/SusD family nutrient uptake outer membrane protein [Muribaculaceae bacterium]